MANWDNNDIAFGNHATAIDSVGYGYVIYLCGTLFLHLGLQVGRPDERRPRVGSESASSGWALAGLWSCGVVALWGFATLSSAIGSLIGNWGYLALACVCVFALNPPRLFRHRAEFWWVLLTTTVLQVLVQAATGLKGQMMLAFLPLIWLGLFRRRQRWLLVVAPAAVVVVYSAIVNPIVALSRNRGTAGSTNIVRNLYDACQQWSGQGGIRGDAVPLGQMLSESFGRLFDAHPVAIIVQDVQLSGYLNGESLGYVGYAFVPRLIWRDKPMVSRGRWMTVRLGWAKDEESATTSTGITMAGELYWNFGMLGVAAGMFFIGWLDGRLLWCMVGNKPALQPLNMTIYLVAMFTIIGPEAGATIVSIISAFLLFRVTLYVVNRAPRSRRFTGSTDSLYSRGALVRLSENALTTNRL